MRGRAQVLWLFDTQLRANAARDWLNGQLLGRSYIPESTPSSFLLGTHWLVVADVAIETVLEGQVVRDLCLARQDADLFVLAGSYTQFHSCDHYDQANDCADTVERVTK